LRAIMAETTETVVMVEVVEEKMAKDVSP
jgi:hypothetical protein